MISLFLTTVVSLFSLINPLSAIPVFMSLTANYKAEQLKNTVKKTAIYVFVVCLVSFYIGVFILDFFGITIHALQLAGAIIISRSGFLLLNSQHKNDIQGPIMEESENKEDISFSPLAMPLLAGPGSISLLINLSIASSDWKSNAIIVSAIVTVCFIIFSILYAAPKVLKYLGQSGLRSMSKIMGFIVLALGIQMAVDSIKMLFELA
jgi:multiple antibiotic resistance protein